MLTYWVFSGLLFHFIFTLTTVESATLNGLNGKLRVLAVDEAAGKFSSSNLNLQYQVELEDGTWVELESKRFKQLLAQYQDGESVSLKGELRFGQLHIKSIKRNERPDSRPTWIDPNSILYISVSTQNTQGKTLAGLTQTAQQVKERFSTISYGIFRQVIAPTIAVKINLPNETTCPTTNLLNLADSEALNQGTNVSNYRYRVYAINGEGLNCNFAGFATFRCGLENCRAVVSDWGSAVGAISLYVHELGHNLGLEHSLIFNNSYPDLTSPMGGLFAPGFYTAPQTAELGWIEQAGGKVLTITSSGRYKVRALHTVPSSSNIPQLIKFNNSESSSSKSTLYMSFRQNVPTDQVEARLTNGVHVHYSKSNGRDLRLAAILTENASSDNTGLAKITSLKINPAEKSVEFDFLKSCNLSAPIESLSSYYGAFSPGQSQEVTLMFQYSAEQHCPDVKYDLEVTTPEGINVTLARKSFNIKSGTTVRIKMLISTDITQKDRGVVIVRPKRSLYVENFSPLSFTVFTGSDHLNPSPGLFVTEYLGQWSYLPNFKRAIPTRTQVHPRVNSLPFAHNRRFAQTIEGFLKVPASGLYSFRLISDDGSKFYINNSLFIDNDGIHGQKSVDRNVYLQQGHYPIRVEHFNAQSGHKVYLHWDRGTGFGEIQPEQYFHLPGTSLCPTNALNAEISHPLKTLYPGTPAQVQLKIDYRNIPQCSLINMNIKSAAMPGHEVAINPTSLAISPGQAATINVQATVLSPDEHDQKLKLSTDIKGFNRWPENLFTLLKIQPQEIATVSGLKRSFAVGPFTCFPDFHKLNYSESKIVPNFALDDFREHNDYALLYEGYLNIERSGYYHLLFSVVDYGRIYVDNELIYDGASGIIFNGSETIKLTSGLHPLRIEYQGVDRHYPRIIGITLVEGLTSYPVEGNFLKSIISE